VLYNIGTNPTDEEKAAFQLAEEEGRKYKRELIDKNEADIEQEEIVAAPEIAIAPVAPAVVKIKQPIKAKTGR